MIQIIRVSGDHWKPLDRRSFHNYDYKEPEQYSVSGMIEELSATVENTTQETVGVPVRYIKALLSVIEGDVHHED